MNLSKNNTSLALQILVLAVLVYMPIFGHLDRLPIRLWDEARVTMNAYEMYFNGDFLVAHYQGLPDMWNTKPPLLLWLQVLSMKMFGVNELALRLPSALAAFFTCVALFLFFFKYFKNTRFGFIVVLVLITSQGYISNHGTRTGDYDALMTLFTTLYGLYFFVYCEKQKSKYLYFFFLFLTLGVMTKGVNALLFGPALFLFALLQGKLFLLLKNKHLYFALLGFLLIVGGFYFIRESYNPGYWEAVVHNELGGRYLEVKEGNTSHFWMYLYNIIDFQYTAWYLLIPCGVIIGLTAKDDRLGKVTHFAGLMVLVFFLVISFGKTKTVWYDIPMYPFLAILVTVFLSFLFKLLQNIDWLKQNFKWNPVPFILLGFFCIQPYKEIIDKTYKPVEQEWDKEMFAVSYYLRDAIDGKFEVKDQVFVFDGYIYNTEFYRTILNKEGKNLHYKNWKELNQNETVVVPQYHLQDQIEKKYNFELLGKYQTIKMYKILNQKEQEKATQVSNGDAIQLKK